MASPEDSVKEKGGQLPVRTRKSKGKSRGGCIVCKQRKIKCDETRPTCTKCKASSRPCIYDTKSSPKWKQNVKVMVMSPPLKFDRLPKVQVMDFNSSRLWNNISVTDADILSDYGSPGYQLSTMPTGSRYTFRSEDSSLLAHFIANTSCGLVGNQAIWLREALSSSFQNDFLMHSMLSLSARHIQHLQGCDAQDATSNLNAIEVYHHQQALSTYQKAFRFNTIRINQDAVLATSLLLCYYSCSILDFQPSTKTSDSCLTFFPGIRSIVSDAPHVARNGLFRSIVSPPIILKNVHPSTGPGARLLNFLDAMPVSTILLENKALYIERIESLTLYMSTCTMQNLEADALPELLLCFLRWQSFCPKDFVDLISEFDPVALVILAHYYAAGGFAQSRAGETGWWWWQKKPSYMIRTITEHLGPAWNAWLGWPKSMLERSGKGKLLLDLTGKDISKVWSAAVDSVESSFFVDLYDWDTLKRFSNGQLSSPGLPC